jgi:hypothetical protein
MGEAGRWKPYVRRQGPPLPAFDLRRLLALGVAIA